MSALPKPQSALFVVQRSSEFDEWWAALPSGPTGMKKDKGHAEKAFARARKVASLDELIEGVRRYAAEKPPWQAFCNPATWLNGKRWLDESSEPAPPEAVAHPTRIALDPAENERRAQEWMRRLREFMGYDPFPPNAKAADFVKWYRNPTSPYEMAALRAVGWFGDDAGGLAGTTHSAASCPADISVSADSRDPIRAVLRELGVTAREAP